MEEALIYIQQHAQIAPYLIFGLLLLAGLNVPVSEDIMLFTSAMLAVKNPDLLVPLFVGVYLGAYISDIISYWLGRTLGPKLWDIKFFSKMVTKEQVEKIHAYYDNYGVLTLVLGRFIPFGVRNGLFLTAGLGKMNFTKFALSDLLAATISCSTFFYLYYTFGDSVIEYVKKFNIIIFSFAAIIVTLLVIRKYLQKKKSKNL